MMMRRDERHEAEEQISQIHRPNREDQDERTIKALDEKSLKKSKALEDVRLSGFSVRNGRHEVEEQISQIHRSDTEEEDQDEHEDVQKEVKHIFKEKWKKRLITNAQDISNHYTVGKQLGKKTEDIKFLSISGHRKTLPAEVTQIT
ncbi:hypothetical protein E1301_Tti016825 [Triplophysa tibetana]|uniref:Uncharacterized protein n=1 Tax=Triplophysa tibetana TaxID=1572043 RepID=A0A5A9PF49_9TELE|nr:hypothetical protein E1301_Tti016825 [Triplophysa tibetana]